MQFEGQRGDDQRSNTDRNVDEEDPFPAPVVGEPTAQQRTGYRRDAENGSKESLILATLTRWDHVTDYGESERHQAAGSEALNGPARDHHIDSRDAEEVGNLRGETADQRADQEDDDRGLKDRPPAAQARELAPE